MGQQPRIVAFVSERIGKAPAPENFGRPVEGSEGGSPVVRKARQQMRPSTAEVARATGEPEIRPEEKQILRKALKHLVFKHGHLLVPTSIRQERDQGSPRWIIAVALRYPTGFEGEIGDLLYDGQEFTFLTPPEVREQRARKIAEDPEALRQWNEYRASTLPPGEG
jgi:hypothetical protein